MSFLDALRIATPCTESWAGMTGDERSRHCKQCDKTVFDVSKLTRAEAESLIAAKSGNLCARYFERTDGTIVLADCLVRPARRRMVMAGMVAALAGAGVIATREQPVEVETLDALELADHADADLGREVETAADDPAPEDVSALARLERLELVEGSHTIGVISSLAFTRITDDETITDPVASEHLRRAREAALAVEHTLQSLLEEGDE